MLTRKNQYTLGLWAFQWFLALPESIGLDVEDTRTEIRGKYVATIFCKDKSSTLTVEEMVTQEELNGLLNLTAHGTMAAAGEITDEELRQRIGLALSGKPAARGEGE